MVVIGRRIQGRGWSLRDQSAWQDLYVSNTAIGLPLYPYQTATEARRDLWDVVVEMEVGG